MKTAKRKLIKGQWELQRATKYTTLLLKGKPYRKWTNEAMDSIIKEGFEKQVEYFKENLK